MGRRQEESLRLGWPYAQSTTTQSGPAPLGRGDRAGWLMSAGLHWDRLALDTGTPAVAQEHSQASLGLFLSFNGSLSKSL